MRRRKQWRGRQPQARWQPSAAPRRLPVKAPGGLPGAVRVTERPVPRRRVPRAPVLQRRVPQLLHRRAPRQREPQEPPRRPEPQAPPQVPGSPALHLPRLRRLHRCLPPARRQAPGPWPRLRRQLLLLFRRISDCLSPLKVFRLEGNTCTRSVEAGAGYFRENESIVTGSTGAPSVALPPVLIPPSAIFVTTSRPDVTLPTMVYPPASSAGMTVSL